MHRLYATTIDVTRATANEGVPPERHTCDLSGCTAMKYKASGYAIASVLKFGGREGSLVDHHIQSWMSVNKSFRIGDRSLVGRGSQP
jgi:hypothetical protein